MTEHPVIQSGAALPLRAHGWLFLRVLWIVVRLTLALLAAHKGVHFVYQGF